MTMLTMSRGCACAAACPGSAAGRSLSTRGQRCGESLGYVFDDGRTRVWWTRDMRWDREFVERAAARFRPGGVYVHVTRGSADLEGLVAVVMPPHMDTGPKGLARKIAAAMPWAREASGTAGEVSRGRPRKPIRGGGRVAAPVLRLADDLVLDLGAYASTGWRAGVWASSGRGKSYAVGVIVEELLDAHIPVVVIDPEGEFWTLREGYRTVVVGGPRGDLPLCGARPAVREILGVALGQGLALVVDLSDLAANAAQQEAARPFLEELFVLLGRERRTAGVVVEEAHVFAPQFGSASTAEIMSRLAKQGRKRGVLLVAASQRTQAVSKEFMSQLNFPMLGGFDEKLDFDAVKHHAAGRTFQELNGLPVGVFWFPRLGEFHRIRARRVTHGGDTPDLGGEVVLRSVVADGDLEAAVARLAEAVRQARAAEEAERGEIARLRRWVEELETELAEKTREVERLQVALRVAAAQAAAGAQSRAEARVSSVSVRANRVEVAAAAPAPVHASPAAPAVPVAVPAGGVALLDHPAVQNLLGSACSLTRKALGGYESYCVAALEALARSRSVSPSELALALGLGSPTSVSRVRVACRQLVRVGLACEEPGDVFSLRRENLEKAIALAEARATRKRGRRCRKRHGKEAGNR